MATNPPLSKKSFHSPKGPVVGYAEAFQGRNIGTEREEQRPYNSFYFVTAERSGVKVHFAVCTTPEELNLMKRILTDAGKEHIRILQNKS